MSPPKSTSIFCVRLRTARKAAGLSQKQLGIAIGLDEFVASTRINRYEVGVHEPDIGTALRMAQALKVPLPYLYAENEHMAELIRAIGALTIREQEALLKSLRESASR